MDIMDVCNGILFLVMDQDGVDVALEAPYPAVVSADALRHHQAQGPPMLGVG